MKNNFLFAIVAVQLLTLLARSSSAGVYSGTAFCSLTSDCFPLAFVSDPAHTVPPFALAHPPGYAGAGGLIEVRICVEAGSEALLSPARRAVATWNRLIATTGNCLGCAVWEEGSSGMPLAHAESTLLHELGHCPLGLEHPERNWDAQSPPDGLWEFTSFTRSWGVAAPPAGIQPGPDFIRGTLDDVQLAAGGALPESVHWFRIADNNPVVVDGTVIDTNTFSRSVAASLPAGHS